MAHLAGDIYVGQEVHLDLQHAVAAAGLAAAALGVEGESSLAVAPGLGLLGGGEQIADLVEQPRIGGGIGAGGAADGALVDAHHLVQELLALYGVVPAGPGLHAVQVCPQALEDDLVDQRGFPGPGHAGNAGKGPQGDGYVDMPQIVFRRTPDGEKFPAAGTALFRHGNGPFAA